MPHLTSDLVDREPEIASCTVQFRLFGRRRRFAGPIRTIRCRTDNALIREAVNSPSKGEVLVVDAAGSLERALLGDKLAGLAMDNGWAGIIIHGAVRDTAALDAMEFGVKSVGANPRKSERSGDGEAGVTLEFGGVRFVPGEWLYSDEDGILVRPEPFPAD